MMRYLKTILMAGLLAGSALAGGGMELTLSRPHPGYAVPDRWIGSLSYFRLSPFPWPGFSEVGLTSMFPVSNPAGASGADRAESFIGGYTGHAFPLWRGLVRPGFQVGSTWTEVRKDEGDSKGEFRLYYAFRIQVSCLTYILSDRGQGFGFNFSF